jgi:hypothetical protein
MRHHLKQAAPRRMIFPIGLKVLCQMLDSVREKCDLHIRAARIVFMQLELLKAHGLIALCHNKAGNLDEDRVLATTGKSSREAPLFPGYISFAFSVVPKVQSCA